MPRIERFEDIDAWKAGRMLVKDIYAVASRKPFAADFGFKDQMTRAAVSITSNIAEGFDRGTDREFLQFLKEAKGSAAEVKSLLYNAFDLAYITAEEFERLLHDTTIVGMMLSSFMTYLKNSCSSKPSPPSCPRPTN